MNIQRNVKWWQRYKVPGHFGNIVAKHLSQQTIDYAHENSTWLAKLLWFFGWECCR